MGFLPTVLRRASLALAMMIVVALGGAASAQDKPLRGIALVIGESDYANVTPLANPERDARAMDDLLDSVGFEVDRVLDADRDKLMDRIEGFIADAEGADVALIYYSGHGVEIGGENYLLPTDADVSSPESAGASLVQMTPLLEKLAATVPVTILLLDACRTNPFPAGTQVTLPGSDGPVQTVASEGLAEMRGPTPVASANVDPESLGVVIGFAASPGQPALDGASGENSPYAAALIKHMSAGGYSFGDLMTLVSEEVYLKTKAKQLPWVNSSLRRILSFGAPAEEAEGDAAAIRDGRRQLLMTIAASPAETRAYVRQVAEAQDVPMDALYGMLKVLGVDAGAGDLEAQLLEGARRLKTFTEERPGSAKSDPELVRLAGLADQAEAEGAIDLALGFREQASARAEMLSTERDELEAGINADRVEIAATFGDHAQTASLNFDYAMAADKFGAAYDEVSANETDAALSLYYKWMQAAAYADLGNYTGDTGATLAAIDAYQVALDYMPREIDPKHWARLMNDLGVALQSIGLHGGGAQYLVAAAEALTGSLEVRTLEDDPQGWAATQNNLGMVLGTLADYEAGTEKLVAAIDAYNNALGVFTRDAAPFEWAATQQNLGTVLQSLGNREQSIERMEEAEAAYLASLEVRTREWNGRQWALTYTNLANVYLILGTLRDGTGDYQDAIEAYLLALEEIGKDESPYDWANTQNGYGLAILKLGQRGDDGAAIVSSIAELEKVFVIWTEDDYPIAWAATQNNIGIAYRSLGELGQGTADLEKAIAAFKDSLRQRTRKIVPLDWAFTTDELAWAMMLLGERNADRAKVQEARDLLQTADEGYRQMGYALDDYFGPRYERMDAILESLS